MSESKLDDRQRVAWKEFLKRMIVRRFDAALVGGSLHADYLVELGFCRDRIHYGYDVVDNQFFTEGASKARERDDGLRACTGLPMRFFLASARFLRRKNVDGLLRAYRDYRSAAGPNSWGLVILGDGAERERLVSLQQELGLRGVVWSGFVQYEDLPMYYGLAGAFIHPARAEAWGLVVNEAAASRLPLLVSDSTGAAAELVVPGVNGFIFDPNRQEEMASVLFRVASLPEVDRVKMGESSLEIVNRWGPKRFGYGLLAAATS